MYFKIIERGTNRKLVYDFLLVVYSNFCHIMHRSWEIWCETVNDLEICPRSLTVASCESCRVAMYVKCSVDSERKKRKSPFSTTTLSFDAPRQQTPVNICINLILPETTFPGLHFCRWQYMGSSASFRTDLSESRRGQPISCQAQNRF